MTKTDNKGRVLRESELIAKDLRKLIDKSFDEAKDKSTDEAPNMMTNLVENLVKYLTVYVLEQRAEDFFNGERVGLIEGRKEAGAMFLSAFGAELPQVLKTDPIYKSVYDTAMKAAERAVAAISKSTDQGGLDTPDDHPGARTPSR